MRFFNDNKTYVRTASAVYRGDLQGDRSDTMLSCLRGECCAALDSTLISLRCFNEFFGSHRRDDDIRASDFPGVTMQPFLSRDDENAIHKYLAHITVTRSNTATKHWFIDHMVIFGLQHGVQFLSIIEDTFPPNTEAGRIELSCVREAARLLIPKIVSLQKTKRD